MQQRFNVFDCMMIELPGESDRSGAITSVTNLKEIPFSISRSYYLYDIPAEPAGADMRTKIWSILLSQYVVVSILPLMMELTKRQFT